MKRLAALAVLILSMGCERRLPGPAECRAFAQYALQGATPMTERQLAILQERIETLTQECLTTPYDRETLRCAQVTGRPRECVISLKNRLATPQRSVAE